MTEDTDESGTSATQRDDTTEPTKPKRRLRLWQETVLLVVVAVVLAVVIKSLFVQSFYIPSPSMEPGLVKNDRIMVEKWSYWFGGSPQRGDVVVFEDPGDWLNPEEAAGPTNPVTKAMAKVGLYPEGGHLVKRVIGVEGDVITCCDKQGRISVNGTPLDETEYARQGSGECFGPMTGDCDWSAGPVPDGPHLRDGRQPQQLGRLVVPPVRRAPRGLRAGRRVRLGGPRGGQGVRRAVAEGPLPLGRPPGRAGRRP